MMGSSTRETRGEALDGLHHQLQDLLRILDGASDPHDDASGLESALESCQRRFDALRNTATNAESTHSEDERSYQSRLEQVLRLNAVCLGRIESESDVLSRALVQTRAQSRSLPALRSEPASGRSCDVSC